MTEEEFPIFESQLMMIQKLFVRRFKTASRARLERYNTPNARSSVTVPSAWSSRPSYHPQTKMPRSSASFKIRGSR